MAANVCDVFAVAIKERFAFLYRNRKNVGGVERGRRSRPSETEPRMPERIQSWYVQCPRTPYFLLYYLLGRSPVGLIPRSLPGILYFVTIVYGYYSKNIFYK
jgi:hypothetical protein